MPTKQRGFTLVELAIVVAIIGLIAGGILVGRDMMRSAEIRSAIDESQAYIQALNNFKDKYGELPGDFSAAIDFWGANHAVLATCPTLTINHTATCNGDGNGWITSQATATTHYEQFHAWHQLYNAEMVPHWITPLTAVDGTQDRSVGYNIPPSKLEGAGWGLVGLPVKYVAVTNTTLLTYNTNDLPPRHVLYLGGNSYKSYVGTPHQQPLLSGTEAKRIDDKIDDGRPNHGKLVVQKNPSGLACNDTALTYDTSTTDKRCTLIFKTGL